MEKPAQSTVFKAEFHGEKKKKMSWELLNSTATQVLLFILSNMLLVKKKKNKEKEKSQNQLKIKSAEQITVLRSISNTHSTRNEKRNAVGDATANDEH